MRSQLGLSKRGLLYIPNYAPPPHKTNTLNSLINVNFVQVSIPT